MSSSAVRCVILDDYQDAARDVGPWSELDGVADVTVFTDHVADPDALAERLARV